MGAVGDSLLGEKTSGAEPGPDLSSGQGGRSGGAAGGDGGPVARGYFFDSGGEFGGWDSGDIAGVGYGDSLGRGKKDG